VSRGHGFALLCLTLGVVSGCEDDATGARDGGQSTSDASDPEAQGRDAAGADRGMQDADVASDAGGDASTGTRDGGRDAEDASALDGRDAALERDGEAGADAGGEGCPDGLKADCLGVCGGTAQLDECGVCNGNGASKDCMGICGGTATCGVPQPGSLIVSEVMYNPATVDDAQGEWFEVYNPTNIHLNLEGCTIADNAGTVTITEPLWVAPKSYLTFANGQAPGFTPSFVYTTPSFALSNSNDRIVITCAAGEIERFEYTASDRPAGVSLSVAASALSPDRNKEPHYWCPGAVSYNGDFGTPGSANPDCVRPARSAGDLVITEIMVDPFMLSDGQGEWIELYNPGSVGIDLLGCVLRDDDNDRYAVDRPFVVPPRAYATLASHAEPGFWPGHVYTGFQLGNNGDEVVIECDKVVIDRVAYDTTWPRPIGASLSLDPNALSASANDSASAWCAGTTAYGDGDKGTPNAANPACP
jgi:hypothetical protein